MSAIVREWLINVGMLLIVAILASALRAGLGFLRTWGEVNIKNKALKDALDYVLGVADTLVKSSADRVRKAKASGGWNDELATVIRNGVIADLNETTKTQLDVLRSGNNVTPEQFEKFVMDLVESRVEHTRSTSIPAAAVVGVKQPTIPPPPSVPSFPADDLPVTPSVAPSVAPPKS